MASDQHPHSKVHPFSATAPNPYPSFPKPEPIVVELPADDLIEAGQTRPIHVASLHQNGVPSSGPGRATPFTPPPPAMQQEPVVLPPQMPPPAVGFGTMPSVAWQGPPQSEYPQSQPYVQMAQPAYPQQQQYPSFAPTAMDVQQQPYMQQPVKKKSRAGLIIGIVLGVGFFGLLGVGGAGFAYWKYYLEPAAEQAITQASVQDTSSTTTTSTTTSTPAATTATPAVTADKAKVDPAPAVTTNKIASAPATTTTTTWKPTTTTARATTKPKDDVKVDAKVEPKTDAKTDPKADAKVDAPAEGGTGTIRSYTAEAGKPITVDGAMAGVAPAPLTVKCGAHQIQVGSGPTKNVNVPCGGAVTVGSPDGT